ncbi:Tryptophan--tRNA ligase [uncultured archaeon]|nr:Tryptophan--tRNA ligase [uncultured archaeon]
MNTQERIDPWGSEGFGDYEKLIAEFGMESLSPFKKDLSDNLLFRRNIIFGHRDFGKILDAIKHKKPYAMMTGLMPSGKFHLGHKMVADEIIWHQKKGADVFVCAADLEAYLMRDITLSEAKKIAVEEYVANYIALGLDMRKVHFWFQTDYETPYYRFRDTLSHRTTFNEMKAIYGTLSPEKIFSVITQAADILHPQLPEYGGPRPTVVPVGADQDPHIRLTRDIAGRHKEHSLIPPSATYHKFMPGLLGGKMSSSNPKSHIALTDSPKEAKKKVLAAFSGGGVTVEEHKKNGGNPEVDVACQYLFYGFEEDDRKVIKIFEDYRAGTLMTGEVKKLLADKVAAFLEAHQAKYPEALREAKEIVKK